MRVIVIFRFGAACVVPDGESTLNFRFFGRFRFDFYLGVLGFDIGLTKNGLVLTTSIPYDPLVYQLGLGWRF